MVDRVRTCVLRDLDWDILGIALNPDMALVQFQHNDDAREQQEEGETGSNQVLELARPFSAVGRCLSVCDSLRWRYHIRLLDMSEPGSE